MRAFRVYLNCFRRFDINPCLLCAVGMQSLVEGWPARADELRERYFRRGIYSMLRIVRVHAKPDGSMSFTWRYQWRDMGMETVVSKRVRIEPREGGWYLVNGALACGLEGLERACFEGEWEACRLANLREITGEACFSERRESIYIRDAGIVAYVS